MKKILAIVLCLAMLLTIVACATDELDTPTVTESPVATLAPATDAPVVTTSPTEAPTATETPATSDSTYILKIPSGSSSSSSTATVYVEVSMAADETYTLSGDDNYKITLSDDDGTYTIDGDTTGDVIISGDATTLTINAPNSHVEYEGTAETVNATTSASTFVTGSKTVISKLNINGGNASLAGEITTLSVPSTNETTTSVEITGVIETSTIAAPTVEEVKVSGTATSLTIAETVTAAPTITTTGTAEATITNKASGTVILAEDESKVVVDTTADDTESAYVQNNSSDATVSIKTGSTDKDVTEVKSGEEVYDTEAEKIVPAEIPTSTDTEYYILGAITEDKILSYGKTYTIGADYALTDGKTITNYGTIEVSTVTELECALTIGGKVDIADDLGSVSLYTIYFVELDNTTVTSSNSSTVYGTFIVKGDNVTIDGLTIGIPTYFATVTNDEDATVDTPYNDCYAYFWIHKAGIYVVNDNVTIINNNFFFASTENNNADAIAIVPYSKSDVAENYVITNNTFTNENATGKSYYGGDLPYTAYGIVVYDNWGLEWFNQINEKAGTISSEIDYKETFIDGNTFNGIYALFQIQDVNSSFKETTTYLDSVDLSDYTILGSYYVLGNSTVGEDMVIAAGATLTIEDGATLTNNGTLTIEDGATLTNNGTLTNNDGGIVILAGTLTGNEISGGGTILTQSAVSSVSAGLNVAVIQYSITDNKASIIAHDTSKKNTNVIIPSEIQGASVTTIANSALGKASTILTISLPNTITTIDTLAFKAQKLMTSVEFEEGSVLTSIGTTAFKECYALTSINLPTSVQTIGDSAFISCTALSTVNFDELTNLASIGASAFSGTVIENVVMPSSLSTIGATAFAYNSSLKSVTFNDTVSVSGDTFDECYSLQTISVPDTHATLADIDNIALVSVSGGSKTLLSIAPNGSKNISIPEGVTDIRGFIFKYDDFVSVSLPSTLKTIGANAFDEMPELTSITIPASVTTIYENAFSGCDKLATVTFEENSNLATIGDSAFSFSAVESIALPNSVTSLGSMVFKGCTSMTSLTLPTAIETLPEQMVEECTSLTSLTIPSTVTSIGERAFCSSGITELIIPSGVTYIGYNAMPTSCEIKCVASGAGESWDEKWNYAGNSVTWDYTA